MEIQVEIFLNQIAQNIYSDEQGLKWFENFDNNTKKEIIRYIYQMATQAGLNELDIDLAIKNSKLKPTYTPCVLIKKGKLNIQATKIFNLPENEYSKIFLLFIQLFKISDERRRKTKCLDSCTHWWHKDLKDQSVIDMLIKRL